MMTHEKIMASRQLAGRVMRYHTHPTLRKQSVNEHQARVAKLYVELWGMPRAEVLYYCLAHDDGELAAGDTPFYAKRAVPELKTSTDAAEKMGQLTLGQTLPVLEDEEWSRFKLSDLLEMWEYSVVERNMGNRYADTVLQNLRPAIMDLARRTGVDIKMMNWLRANQPEERTYDRD